MPTRVPYLQGTHLIPTAGPVAQQEQPQAVNEALLNFLASVT